MYLNNSTVQIQMCWFRSFGCFILDITDIFTHILWEISNTNTYTGSPLIGRKNGSIFLTNRLMRTVNKIAVLWEDLKNLLNKAKPSYREIRPMRGRLMRGPPVNQFHEFFALKLSVFTLMFDMSTFSYLKRNLNSYLENKSNQNYWKKPNELVQIWCKLLLQCITDTFFW